MQSDVPDHANNQKPWVYQCYRIYMDTPFFHCPKRVVHQVRLPTHCCYSLLQKPEVQDSSFCWFAGSDKSGHWAKILALFNNFQEINFLHGIHAKKGALRNPFNSSSPLFSFKCETRLSIAAITTSMSALSGYSRHTMYSIKAIFPCR